MSKLDEDKFYFDCEIMGHYDYLLCLINTMSKDCNLAADIVQETMAWGKLDQIRQYKNLKNTLAAIAKNKLMNHYRKYNKEPIATPAVNKEVIIDRFDEDNIAGIIKEEMRLKLLMTIAQLRPDYVQIILMHYYYELPLRDISEIININYNTVVCWHRRALKSLGKLLNEHSYFSEKSKEKNK